MAAAAQKPGKAQRDGTLLANASSESASTYPAPAHTRRRRVSRPTTDASFLLCKKSALPVMISNLSCTTLQQQICVIPQKRGYHVIFYPPPQS